jgi:hypothetical protein
MHIHSFCIGSQMAGTSMHAFGASIHMTIVQAMPQALRQAANWPKASCSHDDLEADRPQFGDGPSIPNECRECRHFELKAAMDSIAILRVERLWEVESFSECLFSNIIWVRCTN